MPLSPERTALLKQQTNDYIALMEAQGKGVNYNRITTDKLLILEALNDWSGRKLSEGGNITFTYACADPACATYYEASELTNRMHAQPVVLYPVSGFILSDKDELRFTRDTAQFRMLSHTSGSRTDGIAIAEVTHIRDAEAAMQLWVLCATEDCLAYLLFQMNEHNLYFDDESLAAARQIITSSLNKLFSIGQVWNAIWRSVRDAAALSNRQFYNIPKASKTIPKKIDAVLMKNAGNLSGFESYERLASVPIGAVLSLMLNRFGIADNTPGPEVRSRFAADALLASPAPDEEDDDDEGRGLVRGSMFFSKNITPLDQIILSSFKNIRFDTPEPEWDENHVIGRLDFVMDEIYAFDGLAFCQKFLTSLNLPIPNDADYARHAAIAKTTSKATGFYTDVTGYTGAYEEVFSTIGIDLARTPSISRLVRYPTDPDDIMVALQDIPGDFGLTAIRVDSAHVYGSFIEQSCGLYTGAFSFKFPELSLEPEGCDTDVVKALLEPDFGRLVSIAANAVMRSITTESPDLKNRFIRGIAECLLAQTDPVLADDASGTTVSIEDGSKK